MWTFQYRFTNPLFTRQWTTSGRRHENWKMAWEWAGAWAWACYENDEPIEVRLVKVDA